MGPSQLHMANDCVRSPLWAGGSRLLTPSSGCHGASRATARCKGEIRVTSWPDQADRLRELREVSCLASGINVMGLPERQAVGSQADHKYHNSTEYRVWVLEVAFDRLD